MDTISHIVLGACIGEVIAGKQLGKKVLVVGAIANSLPDIDFVASFWLPTAGDLVAHRAITHSLLFVALLTPLLAFLSGRLFKNAGMRPGKWALFWGLQMFIHLFIDSFNAYGTGLFEPFSHYRVSFNSMYVADPLFTIWPAVAAVALMISKVSNTNRTRWAIKAITITGLYILSGVLFKLHINDSVVDRLNKRNVTYKRFFTTPTPLNNLLWFVVAENDSGYYAGYISLFDDSDKMNLHFDYRNDSLLKPYKDRKDVAQLLQFSGGYYVVQQWHDTTVFSILRFGEMLGWAQSEPRCAFYYYLEHPDNNKLIVQRGRFAGWNMEVFRQYIKRIGGH